MWMQREISGSNVGDWKESREKVLEVSMSKCKLNTITKPMIGTHILGSLLEGRNKACCL